MADIANVTGTLDDKELNFQHSIGTVYKASASIDGSEKDHVAVLTATDSAGNSTTETMVISISGSWTTPKQIGTVTQTRMGFITETGSTRRISTG